MKVAQDSTTKKGEWLFRGSYKFQPQVPFIETKEGGGVEEENQF